MPWAALLGNGFSRAYNDTIFAYDALYNAADLSGRLQQVFDMLGTTDFEQVMRTLDQVRTLLEPYGVPIEFQQEMARDTKLVRESLIQALASHHPPDRTALEEAKAKTCARFLNTFDRIFTMNYDLLLYWVFVDYLTHKHQDGFGPDPLHWLGPAAPGQTVYYLHGALHLYDDGAMVHKLSAQPGLPILGQLEALMDSGDYPLFVSEGTSSQKMSRIRSNPYLFDAYEALSRNAMPLLIYGFKFGDMDQHILDAIASSSTPELIVVIHDHTSRDEEIDIISRTVKLANRTPTIAKNFRFRKTREVAVWA